jgi:hypothetical protein
LHSFMGHMAKDGFIYLLFCTYFPKAKLHLYIVRIRRHCLCGLRSCQWDACSNDSAERDGAEWRAMMCRSLVVLDQILHSANRNNYDRRAKIYPAWIRAGPVITVMRKRTIAGARRLASSCLQSIQRVPFPQFLCYADCSELAGSRVPTIRSCPCRTRFAYFRRSFDWLAGISEVRESHDRVFRLVIRSIKASFLQNRMLSLMVDDLVC